MQYREYGETGEKVSALGFGAMRLPDDDDYAVQIMVRGLQLGINYIDTALVYGDGRSEKLVGRAINEFGRENVSVATKNPFKDDTYDGWWERTEESLQNLDVDCIDFFKVVHALTWENWKKVDKPGGVIDAITDARDQGLFEYCCFSSHDSPENIIKLIDTGFFDGMLVQYNLLDRKNEEAIAHANEQGMGVEIMGPVGGGRLGMSSEKLKSIVDDAATTPELALRFVLANSNISIAHSGMGNMDMVEENVAAASRTEPLSDNELQQVEDALKENERLAELYCTGCEYCLPCPQNVGIPQAFAAMNMHRVWGLTEHAKKMYVKLGEDHDDGLLQADACVECGQCEEECPQDIPVIEQLKETHEVLGE